MPGMRILMLLAIKTWSSTKTFMDVDGEDCKSYAWSTSSFYCQILTVQGQDFEHDMIQMIEKIQGLISIEDHALFTSQSIAIGMKIEIITPETWT